MVYYAITMQRKGLKMSQFCKMRFAILLILTVLISGCAKKDPVETVIDHHQQHIGEVLDYAYNNMEQTADVKFLENELEQCSIAMTDIKQTYYGQLSACKAKTDYWRLATVGLFLLVCGLIFATLKRWIKI